MRVPSDTNPLAARTQMVGIGGAMLRGGSLKKFCLLIGFLVLGSWPAAAQTAVRVNCGGNAYTDAKAQVWRADGGYSGGVVCDITGNVAGTTDELPYLNGRYTSDLTNH